MGRDGKEGMAVWPVRKGPRLHRLPEDDMGKSHVPHGKFKGTKSDSERLWVCERPEWVRAPGLITRPAPTEEV